MFRKVPLSLIKNFSLYTQQWYMSYRFADSLRAGSGRRPVACSLVDMPSGTVRVHDVVGMIGLILKS